MLSKIKVETERKLLLEEIINQAYHHPLFDKLEAALFFEAIATQLYSYEKFGVSSIYSKLEDISKDKNHASYDFLNSFINGVGAPTVKDYLISSLV